MANTSSPALARAVTAQSFSYLNATQEDVMEELSSRFILNLPDEELSSLERICFQVEQAHWFYEDFIREENPQFPTLQLKKFSAMLFQACPLLQEWSADHEKAFNDFMQYKTRVPVCGAIMLNETWDKCVLVKGWKSGSGWGFPRGKINERELPQVCAAREVLEETGYNITDKVDPANVIVMSIKEQKISLYIVPGVPENYPFETRTRKEISKIDWFRLTDLPTWKKNKAVPGKFYLISPFIYALKKFIHDNRPIVKKVVKQKPTTKPVKGQPKIHQGSQSSSADNAGPLTPSPQPNAAIKSSSEAVNIDPHFARLFQNLALTEKPKPHQLPSPPPVVSSSPSFILSKDSTDGNSSQSQSNPSESPDWSVQNPPTAKERSNSLLSAPAPSIPLTNSNSTIYTPRHPHRNLPTDGLVPTSHIHTSILRPPSSRRAESIVSDTRSAASRPQEKQTLAFALLESVANESQRMIQERTPVFNGHGPPPPPFLREPTPSYQRLQESPHHGPPFRDMYGPVHHYLPPPPPPPHIVHEQAYFHHHHQPPFPPPPRGYSPMPYSHLPPPPPPPPPHIEYLPNHHGMHSPTGSTAHEMFASMQNQYKQPPSISPNMMHRGGRPMQAPSDLLQLLNGPVNGGGQHYPLPSSNPHYTPPPPPPPGTQSQSLLSILNRV